MEADRTAGALDPRREPAPGAYVLALPGPADRARLHGQHPCPAGRSAPHRSGRAGASELKITLFNRLDAHHTLPAGPQQFPAVPHTRISTMSPYRSGCSGRGQPAPGHGQGALSAALRKVTGRPDKRASAWTGSWTGAPDSPSGTSAVNVMIRAICAASVRDA